MNSKKCINKMSTIKALYLTLIVLFICTLFFSFSACNKVEKEGNTVKDLYIVSTSFFEDEGYMLVTLGLSGTEDKKLNLENAVIITSFEGENETFYQTSTTTMAIDGVATFSAVNNKLTQDEKFYNGMLYSSLKLQFQYATIYKSIISEGIVTKSGKYYVHTFDIDETKEEVDVNLTIRQQKSAAWYGVLIGCSVSAVIIIALIVFIWRRRNGKERK